MRISRGFLCWALVVLVLAGCAARAVQKTHLELKDVPAEIMKVAQQKLPGVKFDAAYREANGDYELRGKDKTGKTREIDIRPDGTVSEMQ